MLASAGHLKVVVKSPYDIENSENNRPRGEKKVTRTGVGMDEVFRKVRTKTLQIETEIRKIMIDRSSATNVEDIIEILEKGSHAANESMLSTKEMLSKKGRSSKLGERSKGHIDPGAASSALIFRTFHEAIQNL